MMVSCLSCNIFDLKTSIANSILFSGEMQDNTMIHPL